MNPPDELKCVQAVVPDRLEELGPLFDETEITLFPHKYVPGDGEPGDRVPLSFLLEPWPSDAHYTQYVHADNTRLLKASDHTALSFSVMIADLDAHDQQTSDDDFYRAVRLGDLLDYPPNVVIKTRGGVHFLYLIAEITDPLVFEKKRLSLIEAVRPIENATPFSVDDTKDWTRMFRAPRVVREDGTDLRETLIWGCHTNVLDTGSWAVKSEPKRRRSPRITSFAPNLRGAVQYAARVPGAVSGEGGHNATFSLACTLIRKFHLDEEQTLQVLEAWNEKCDPPWSERDLQHKVRDAAQAVSEDE